MTAEFNITIPGAEIIKRLADLETQVRDLDAALPRIDALEQRLVELAMTYAPVTYVDKQMELLSGRIYRRLTDEVAVLKDLIDGKIVPAHRDDLASASRVERIAEELADLRRELNLALANGYEETKIVNERLDRHESLIADLIERGDRLTDFVNGKTTRTPEWPHVMPEPPVDTAWHPYDVLVDGVIGDHPTGNKRIMTLARGLNVITGPWISGDLNWGEAGEATIVAWRYAKEGE